MAGTELITAFRVEISHYLGIPYFSNVGIHKNHGTDAQIGKGNAKEIALLTIETANLSHIKLLNFTNQQVYNFQKKHHIGIDCSGLACHLLEYYGSLIGKPANLKPRITSANLLTSPPLSVPINIDEISTADLIRQKSGKHVVIVVEKTATTLTYVDSQKIKRQVKYGQVKLNDKAFFKDGIFRLVAFT